MKIMVKYPKVLVKCQNAKKRKHNPQKLLKTVKIDQINYKAAHLMRNIINRILKHLKMISKLTKPKNRVKTT